MEIENILEKSKDLNDSLNLDTENLRELNKELNSVTSKAIDKAADYVIKAMPVPDAIKDILKDVKEAIKTRDFNNILKTVLKSSIREGLEIIGIDIEKIKDVSELKEIAKKGGLVQNTKNAIEIFENNYLKNNIVGEHIYNFFEKLKNYVLSNKFIENINEFIKKMKNKQEEFFSKCEDWHEAYSNLDFDKIYDISKTLKNKHDVLGQSKECYKENQIIQNMTKMVLNQNKKLSDTQLQLCKTI